MRQLFSFLFLPGNRTGTVSNMFNYYGLKQGGRPYIIAEIGANHNGDMNLARKLITEAKNCGADCVKFQSWTKNSLWSKTFYENNADLEKDIVQYQLSVEDHLTLKEYCDEVGIDFNSRVNNKPCKCQ